MPILNLQRAAAAAFAVAMSATGAIASSMLTQTGNFTISPGFDVPTFQSFDASLGTLTSVYVELSGTHFFSYLAEGDTENGTFTVKRLDEIVLTTEGNFRLEVVSEATLGCDGNSSCNVEVTGTKVFSESATITTGLSAYVGTGDADDFWSAGFSNETLSGSLISFSSVSEFTGTATLTYYYDAVEPPSAVPLPAGMPLLLAGLGGLALVRRRRG